MVETFISPYSLSPSMKWWKKQKEQTIDPLKDIQAILECLNELSNDAKPLLKDLHKLEELEKERQVGRESILPINLEAQAKLLDTILQRYEFFQNDVDINGIRVKEIARNLLKEAKKAGLKDLVQEKKKEMKWQFDW